MHPAHPDTANAQPADPLAGYQPVVLQRTRRDGWTAERQRTFLLALSDSGCISQACYDAGITARSAYRLRADPRGKAFATAWDEALRSAAAKLLTTAYERALKGTYREQWRDGKLVGEVRQPSDKMLMFLLTHLGLNVRASQHWQAVHATATLGSEALAAKLDVLEDVDMEAEPLSQRDFEQQRPLRDHDALLPPFDMDEVGWG